MENQLARARRFPLCKALALQDFSLLWNINFYFLRNFDLLSLKRKYIIKSVLKYFIILLMVLFIWTVVLTFSPFSLESASFSILISSIVPSLSIITVISLTHWISPSNKILVCFITLLLSSLIAYPVYGPGQILDNLFYMTFKISSFKYLPFVSMLISGLCTIFFLNQRNNRSKTINE